MLLKNGMKVMINQKEIAVLMEIRIKTSMSRSDLCDFNDSYIVVKGNITVTEPDNAKKKKKTVTFKNNDHLLIAFQKLMV